MPTFTPSPARRVLYEYRFLSYAIGNTPARAVCPGGRQLPRDAQVGALRAHAGICPPHPYFGMAVRGPCQALVGQTSRQWEEHNCAVMGVYEALGRGGEGLSCLRCYSTTNTPAQRH